MNDPEFRGTDYDPIDERLEPEGKLARETARKFVTAEFLGERPAWRAGHARAPFLPHSLDLAGAPVSG